MSRRRAVIIGAGPAGLTAAYELLLRSDTEVIVLEASDTLGGISRTVNYKGNRIDIGGHRFFSKSQRVMQWWADMMPIEDVGENEFSIAYQGKKQKVTPEATVDPDKTDDVMLVRPRKSRIYYLRKFFDYPLRLSAATFRNLGLVRMLRIGISYVWAMLFPNKHEQSLQDFLINRFGRELYLTFFKSYTEKVWGVPCEKISAEWGAQRIKGLSILKAIKHALSAPLRKAGIGKQQVETSLIERFMYPKFGPGQMWETCAVRVEAMGGKIHMRHRVVKIETSEGRVTSIIAVDDATGQEHFFAADYFFSTMAIVDLVRGMQQAPAEVREISEGLIYRDFITVGLLVKDLKPKEIANGQTRRLTDNWIYIQEPDVKVGRLQIFNNWSPWMVADPQTVWLGLEYFCFQGDELWSRSNEELSKLGVEEMARMGLIDASQVLDSTVIRMPKTYPAYFGTYERFGELRAWIDRIENLFLVGRNGMHRYNNQDHSMLTAMTAVDNILSGRTDKSNIWDVNTEQEYHEEQTPANADATATDKPVKAAADGTPPSGVASPASA